MQTISTHNVTDLPPTDRQAIEHLLGNPLKENEQIFIMAYAPSVARDQAVRDEARREMDEVLSNVEKYAAEHGITDEEAEAAVDEAMEHVRRRVS